jgi:hypothetical protein
VAADTLFFHFVSLFAPAWVVATILTPGVLRLRGVNGWRQGRRRALRVWGVLGAIGSLVLLAGLLYFGRDGKMATYAVLVLAMGSAAAWLRRRSVSRSG